jgi:hypothetical protein
MPIGQGFEIISTLSLGPHRTCHFHGITDDELAVKLNISPNAVKEGWKN